MTKIELKNANHLNFKINMLPILVIIFFSLFIPIIIIIINFSCYLKKNIIKFNLVKEVCFIYFF